MYDNQIVMKLRSVARRTGINKLVGTVIGLLGYEQAFSRRVLGAIRPGDCVWDVGANLGLYSDQFLNRIKDRGRVVAFEPSRECFNSLNALLAPRDGFTAVNAALGATSGTATLFCAEDPLAATHTLSADAGRHQAHTGSSYQVPVFTADGFVHDNPQLHPNVIKIDVEGFEAAVMSGMTNLLADTALRAVFIEVHFTLLEAQGKADAPRAMAAQLRTAGFDVTWPDPSHIAAIRRQT